tara:strand:- start:108 stop:596 length:489 start_codon:yes stop_codon:yes gene_type:complete
MEVNKRLVVKLLCDQVLSKDIPVHTRNFLANLIIASGNNLSDVITTLAIDGIEPPILQQGMYVLYLPKGYKKKELGDSDILIDKGYAYYVDKQLFGLGKIIDTSGYGDFTPYSTEFNLETYGINSDLEVIKGTNSVELLNIISINNIKSTKLVRVIESLEAS